MVRREEEVEPEILAGLVVGDDPNIRVVEVELVPEIENVGKLVVGTKEEGEEAGVVADGGLPGVV
jgi:hypothetical protein